MKYGWLYDNTKDWWLRAAGIGTALVIIALYGLGALVLALIYGFLLAAYGIRAVEESDVEEFGGRRPWADDDFVP